MILPIHKYINRLSLLLRVAEPVALNIVIIQTKSPNLNGDMIIGIKYLFV